MHRFHDMFTRQLCGFIATTMLLIVPVVHGQTVPSDNDTSTTNPSTPVRSGTLLIPGAGQDESGREKKCMTVCARWGEDCTYINRGTAGTTRTCRRSCQQFTEECF